jgi:hypothetical protein
MIPPNSVTMKKIIISTLLAVGHIGSSQAQYSPTGANPPLKLLIDSKGVQTYINDSKSPASPTKSTNSRLATVMGALANFGQLSTNNGTNTSFPPYIISYTGTNQITENLLSDKDVYISFTRDTRITNPLNTVLTSITSNSYTGSELDALDNFVKKQGKSILLIANHGPNGPYNPITNNYNKCTYDDFTLNNNTLAKRFGIQLKPYIVYAGTNGVMNMTVNSNSSCGDLNFLSNQARFIAAHDSCIIVPPTNYSYISLANFPQNSLIEQFIGMSNTLLQTNFYSSPMKEYNSFSILVKADLGKILVIGNSGMFADYGSPQPSCGLISYQNNLMFFLNCVSYLCGDVNIPRPGQVPGKIGTIIP